MNDFSKILYTDEEKGTQWRLTVSEFRDKEYLHVRRYYQNMEGEYHPTKDGASMPFTLNTSWNMFFSLAELLSTRECTDVIKLRTDYEQTNDSGISTDSLVQLLQGKSINT